jgi:hypothetical protein
MAAVAAASGTSVVTAVKLPDPTMVHVAPFLAMTPTLLSGAGTAPTLISVTAVQPTLTDVEAL